MAGGLAAAESREELRKRRIRHARTMIDHCRAAARGIAADNDLNLVAWSAVFNAVDEQIDKHFFEERRISLHDNSCRGGHNRDATVAGQIGHAIARGHDDRLEIDGAESPRVEGCRACIGQERPADRFDPPGDIN